MKRYKAALLNVSCPLVDYVFAPDHFAQLEEITEWKKGIFDLSHVEKGELEDIEVIFSTWGMPGMKEEHFRKLPNLKAVFYAAGATEGFAPGCFDHNVQVFSAWHANAIPVAEYCLGQILLGLKGYFRCQRELTSPEKFNRDLAGRGIYGDTVALVGTGAVSTYLQKLLKAFHINVMVISSLKEGRRAALEEAFKKAAVISNHLPDKEEDTGIYDESLFRSMREGAVFINTGRGRQVVEEDLIKVMEERQDLTALLDVTFPEPPKKGSKLYTMKNILLSPHIAGSLNDEVHRLPDCMIEEYKRYANEEETLYEVKPEMLLTAK